MTRSFPVSKLALALAHPETDTPGLEGGDLSYYAQGGCLPLGGLWKFPADSSHCNTRTLRSDTRACSSPAGCVVLTGDREGTSCGSRGHPFPVARPCSPVPTTHTVGQDGAGPAVSEQSPELGLQPALLEGTCPPILYPDSSVAQPGRTPAPASRPTVGEGER